MFFNFVNDSAARIYPAGFDAASFGAAEVKQGAQSVSPGGIYQGAYGSPTVINGSESVRPSGIFASLFGTAYAYLGQRPLAPPGIAAPPTGTASLINRNRSLLAAGIASPSLAAPQVWLYTRDLKPVGLVATQFATTNRVSHDKQRVQLQAGIAPPPAGSPWVSQGVRWLSPAGAFLDAVGRPQVGGTRYLLAQGWDSSAYGTRIIPVSQSAYPQGFVGVLGAAAIKNKLTFASPLGFETNGQEQFRWGRPTTFNRRQVISLFYDPDSQLNPPGWSPWTAINNRNRVIGHFSGAVARVGEPLIENGARLIAVPGMVSPGYPGTTKAGLVAYGVRKLPLEGIESPLMSRWASVNNAARVLLPPGLASAAIGQPSLENTRRYYRFVGNYDALSVGLPFVAFAIRGISMEPRYAIAPPVVQLPEVKLYTRYIDAPGSDMARIGTPALVIRFTIIKPRWVLRDLFGEPRLRNVTPEVKTKGRNFEEYGDAFVRLEWRPVKPDGSNMQLFGKPIIADRKQRITVPGNNMLRVSDKLVVTKTGSPPYWPQNIIVDSEVDSESVVGNPGLNQSVLYPVGNNMVRFGVAAVINMGIRMEAGIPTDAYGEPTVSLKNRGITVPQWPDSLVYQPSAPRLSPHTIYAVKEAPAQAKANHEARDLHYVGETRDYAPGTRFGHHSIRLDRDAIDNATAGEFSRFGTPSLALVKRYIEPPSIRAYRFGWHTASDGRLFINQFGGDDFSLWGVPGVAAGPYLGPQTIQPAGMPAPAIAATHWVALLHRTLNMNGFYATQMGNSRGEPPYQWQSLHVGPPMPTKPPGFNASAFGLTWISLRVRNLVVPGFDSFRCEYDYEHFAARMRVRNAVVPTKPTQGITAVGVDCAAVGLPNIKPKTHYIRPDGNSDQFRKGAW